MSRQRQVKRHPRAHAWKRHQRRQHGVMKSTHSGWHLHSHHSARHWTPYRVSESRQSPCKNERKFPENPFSKVASLFVFAVPSYRGQFRHDSPPGAPHSAQYTCLVDNTVDRDGRAGHKSAACWAGPRRKADLTTPVRLQPCCRVIEHAAGMAVCTRKCTQHIHSWTVRIQQCAGCACVSTAGLQITTCCSSAEGP